MVGIQGIREFIDNNTSFSLSQIYVGRYYDEQEERVMITYLNTNEQDITFGSNSASYGEKTLSIKYNGSENFATSENKANEIFLAFKNNRKDKDNDITLFKPQQPVLIGRIKGIYKYEIIVSIKFDY